MNVQTMALGMNQLNSYQMTKPQQATNNKENEFSFTLERSKQKQERQDPAVNNKPTLKENVKESPKEEPAQKLENEKTTNDVETEKTKKEKPVEKITKDNGLKGEEDAKVIMVISELLKITPEALEQMLASLQIELADLSKAENLQKLMMQAHGVEQAMDLLLIPEIASEIKAITSVIETHIAKVLPEQIKNESQANPLEDVQVEKISTQTENLVISGKQAKHDLENTQTKNETQILNLEERQVGKVNINQSNNQELSQGEEDRPNRQSNLATEFIDKLTHSMGEVFEAQNKPINETAQTISTRYEVTNPRMILDQIVEKIKVTTLNDEAQMSIQLKPEHLGKLSMEVISKQGIMTAQFTVENEKTKQIIDQNIEHLKQTLEDKGLVIEQLEVTVGQNQQEDMPTYKGSKSDKRITDIINRMMSEDISEEVVSSKQLLDSKSTEVDFTA